MVLPRLGADRKAFGRRQAFEVTSGLRLRHTSRGDRSSSRARRACALYLDSPPGEVLLRLLREYVAGFDELVAALEAGTLTTAEGLTLLNETLGVGWESDAQVKFRLGWVENLGVVVQRSGQWQLASNGPGTT